MSEFEIDWIQAQLNNWSYCFSVLGDGTLCGRAKHWFGHGKPGGHEFETFSEFLSFRREDSRWINKSLADKCERYEAGIHRLLSQIEELEVENSRIKEFSASVNQVKGELAEEVRILRSDLEDAQERAANSHQNYNMMKDHLDDRCESLRIELADLRAWKLSLDVNNDPAVKAARKTADSFMRSQMSSRETE